MAYLSNVFGISRFNGYASTKSNNEIIKNKLYNKGNDWCIMPPELLTRIFSLLSEPKMRLRLSLVCKAWRLLNQQELFDYNLLKFFSDDSKKIANSKPVLNIAVNENEKKLKRLVLANLVYSSRSDDARKVVEFYCLETENQRLKNCLEMGCFSISTFFLYDNLIIYAAENDNNRKLCAERTQYKSIWEQLFNNYHGVLLNCFSNDETEEFLLTEPNASGEVACMLANQNSILVTNLSIRSDENQIIASPKKIFIESILEEIIKEIVNDNVVEKRSDNIILESNCYHLAIVDDMVLGVFQAKIQRTNSEREIKNYLRAFHLRESSNFIIDLPMFVRNFVLNGDKVFFGYSDCTIVCYNIVSKKQIVEINLNVDEIFDQNNRIVENADTLKNIWANHRYLLAYVRDNIIVFNICEKSIERGKFQVLAHILQNNINTDSTRKRFDSVSDIVISEEIVAIGINEQIIVSHDVMHRSRIEIWNLEKNQKITELRFSSKLVCPIKFSRGIKKEDENKRIVTDTSTIYLVAALADGSVVYWNEATLS